MKKITSSALAFLLIFNQFPGMSFAGTGDQNFELDPIAGYQSVRTLADIEQQQSQNSYRPLVSEAEQADAYDFENISPLSPPSSRDSEEYFFDDAVAQFSPDYASAVIVNKLEAADLEKLLKIDQEIGIAVIEGKIVMFTSGSENEIRVVPAAAELLKQSSIMIHTHPEGERAYPSLTDFQEAGEQTEYVVTTSGVWAYNHDGLVFDQPLTYAELADLIGAAHVPGASSKEARDTLNQFIVAIDEYNQNREMAEVLRSAGETVLPGKPGLSVFSGGGASAPNLNLQSDTNFSVQFNVSTQGSYAGTAISFGAAGADLDGLGPIKFGFKTNLNCHTATANCFKVNFVDTAGRVASFWVKGVAENSFEDFQFSKASILNKNANFRMDKVKEIVLVFEYWDTPDQIGTVHVQTAGLDFKPQIASNPALTSAHVSQLPGLFDRGSFNTRITNAGAAVNIPHTLTQSSSSLATLDFDVSDQKAFAGLVSSFDDFSTAGTVETENLSGLSSLVVGVKMNGGTGHSVFVEVEDIFGAKDTVELTGVSSGMKYYNIAMSKFPYVNKAFIKNINFVVTHQSLTGFRAGVLTVDLGGHPFTSTPQVFGIPFDPQTDTTQLSTFSPNIIAGQGTVGTTSGVATSSISTTTRSGNSLRAFYVVNRPEDFLFIPIGGYFDTNSAFVGTPQNFGNEFKMGLAAGPAGKVVKVEITDVSGKKYISNLVLTGSAALYTIPLTGPNLPSGFLSTQIANVVLVIDRASTGEPYHTGTMDAYVNGLYYLPTVTSTTDALTDFMGAAVANAVEPAGFDTVIGFTQTSGNQFSFNYNLANGTGNNRWAAGVIELNAPRDLTVLNSSIVLSATSTTGNFIVEVQDNSVPAKVIKLVGSNGKFIITKAMLDAAALTQGVVGFDTASVSRVVFVANDAADTTGTITVGAANLKFIPNAVGTGLPVTDLSALKPSVVALEPCGQNQSPCLPALGSLDTVQNFTQTGATQIDFDFNLNNGIAGAGDARRYAGAQILFDTGKRLSIPAGGLVLGVTATGVTSYKIELIDNQNRKVSLNSSVVNGNLLITRDMIQAANVPGFNADYVAGIVFVLDQATHTTGHVTVRSNGFAFTPSIAGTAFNQGTLDSFSQLFFLNTFKGTSSTGDNDATVTSSAVSGSEFNFNFSVPDSDDYAGVTFAGGGFDNSALVPKNITISAVAGNVQIAATGFAGALYQLEYSTNLTTWNVAKTNITVNGSNQLITVDDGTIVTPEGVILPHPFQSGVPSRFYRYSLMSGQLGTFVGQTVNVGNTLTLGLEGPAGKQLKLEIRDITGKQYDVLLNLTGAPQNYAIDLASSGLDVTEIAMVNFVTEKDRSGGSGAVRVFANNIQYNAALAPDASVTSATTSLGLKDAVNFASSAPAATSSLTKVSASEYNLTFNVATDDSYAGGIMTFDDFGTDPTKEFSDLSGLTNLDIGLALSAGTGLIVLEIEDINGNKDTVTLTGVDTTQRFWRVPLSSFDSLTLDKTKIRGINTVVLQDNVTSPNAILNVRLGSYYFLSTVIPTTDALTNFMGAAIANAIEPAGFNTVIGFTQTSGNQFSFSYNLANGTGNNRWAAGVVELTAPHDLTVLNSSIVLSATSTTGNFTVEVQDDSVPAKVIKLVGSNGKFIITKAMLDAAALTQGVVGFNAAKISRVVFIADNAMDTVGTITVDAVNLNYAPTVTPSTAALTDFMGAATANAIEPLGLNTVTGFTQPNGNQFSFAYDLSVATGNNRWAGAALQIDTPRDLNAVGSSLVLSATSSTGNFIVEVHDNSAPTPKVIKLVGSNGKFEITKAALQAAAVTQGVTGFSYEVKQVVFVANAAGDTTGTLVVDTMNLSFVPTVTPSTAALTDFMGAAT
ncbi:MAG TPA: hypothetical protein PLY88_05185, partial [Candidatus Omnitrophota bacterium]|nr:hypothetical protein [Candidatus Omnitrophota bacterium]